MRARRLGALLLSIVALSPAPAWTNGGTLRLSRAVAGPYLVSAWTQPSPPRVGRLDLSVAVMSPQTGASVRDVVAHSTAARLDGERPMIAAELKRGAGGNLLLHHGILEPDLPGTWLIVINVHGADGKGTASFQMNIDAPRPWVVPAAVTLVALAVGGTLWWTRSRRRPRRT